MNSNFNLTPAAIAYMLSHANVRIAEFVDIQEDFTHVDGALSINQKYGCKENADEIVLATNMFIEDIPYGVFDYAFQNFDTHFADEYAKSPESKAFPNPHCLFGTWGWRPSIIIDPLAEKTETYIFAKNEFDKWGSNPTGIARDQIKFTPEEEIAYDNLFAFIRVEAGDDPTERLATPNAGTPRDEFLKDKVGKDTVVVLCGVASDVCDEQDMMGYLARGAKVLVLDELTRGIGAPGSRAPETGNMKDVIRSILREHPEYEDQLFTASVADMKTAMELFATPGPRTPRNTHRYTHNTLPTPTAR